jgi:hypothetical protein
MLAVRRQQVGFGSLVIYPVLQAGSCPLRSESDLRLASVGRAKAPTGPRKARPDDKLRAVPTKALREAPMSRYRRLKIEGGAFFCTLALADHGSDLLARFGE